MTIDWQIFRNNVGLVNTNSFLESFNNTMKKVFLSIGGAIDKLDEIILYYSNDERKFTRQPKFVKFSNDSALLLTKKNFRVCYLYAFNSIQLVNK